MEIHASCRLDLNAIKSLIRNGMYRKANPKKRMIATSVFFAVLIAILLCQIVLWDAWSPFGLYAFLLILAYMLLLYCYFLVPHINYRSMAKMKQAENLYIFTDDVLKVTTASQEHYGSAEIKYSAFFKVRETSKYFFLYQTKRQAFVVDKSTLTGGTAEDIRRKLAPVLGKKYTLCRY